MRIIENSQEMAQACREAGRPLGLVPTMGALHDGHFSLIEAAKARTDFVAVTIFVNPLQFGPGEDLDRYPQTFESDLAGCAERGVDLVFAPAPNSMYPAGFRTQVSVGEITKPLEGECRPAHFDGVTTVVAKLFNLTGPCTAMLGRKDYQQWKILSRMAQDLDMPVEVVGCPIVREPDGLALSSRNRYLSDRERARALSIVSGLRSAHDAWSHGERRPDTLRSLAARQVQAAFDRVDYVAAVDPDTLVTPAESPSRLLIAVAAHLGPTRLIDNIVLGGDPRP